MKIITQYLVLWALLAGLLFGQVETVKKLPGNDEITEDLVIPEGRALTVAGTLTVNGLDVGSVPSLLAARASRRAIVSAGTVAFASIPNNGAVDPALADFSVYGWKTRGSSATDYFYAFGTSSSGSYAYFGATNMELHLGTDSGVFTLGPHGLSNGDWALVAVTVDRDGVATGYINGVSIGSADVSSKSAQSATPGTSQSLHFGGNTLGTGSPGSYGEFGWTQSVLTAAQIAAIHANGTARDSGLTMLAHWEPSLSQNVLFEDISGNNLHAIIGTTGITRNYELVESSAPVSQALVSDGSDGSLIYNTLNAQNPGTGDFTLGWAGMYPRDAGVSSLTLGALTPSTVSVNAIRAFWLAYNSTVGLRVILYGSAASYTRTLYSLGLHAQLEALAARGTPCAIEVSRDSSGVAVYLTISGVTHNVTALFTETESASAPAWTDTVNGVYKVGCAQSLGASSAQDLHKLRLFNLAPANTTEAAEMMGDIVPAKWAKGDNTSLFLDNSFEGVTPSTFANGAAIGATGFKAWPTTADGSTIEVVSDVGNDPFGDDQYLVMRRVGAGTTYIYNTSVCTVGRAYRITMWARRNAAEGSGTGIVQLGYGASSVSAKWREVGTTDAYAALNLTDNTWRQYETEVFVATSARIDISNAAFIDIDFDLIDIPAIGQTVGLDLSDGGGYQPKNPRAENGSSQWTMSTSGITWAKPVTYGKTLSVTGSLTWADTHEVKSLLGQEALPANAVVDSITFEATAGSSGDGVTIGTTTDPDQFVAVNSYTTTAENFAGSQLASALPGGTATNDLTIVVDPDTADYTGTIAVTVTYHLADY